MQTANCKANVTLHTSHQDACDDDSIVIDEFKQLLAQQYRPVFTGDMKSDECKQIAGLTYTDVGGLVFYLDNGIDVAWLDYENCDGYIDPKYKV
jgi:hypothetical protein